MNDEALVRYIEDFVKSDLVGAESGHDFYHILRVLTLARKIGASEGADMTIVSLGALLHDIADWKFHGGDESAGPRRARDLLREAAAAPAIITAVVEIVETISFKGAAVPTPMRTVEGKVVQDADRLDALGAIGIARAFAFGNHIGRPFYDPAIPPIGEMEKVEYAKRLGTTLNHFFEKLLLLRDRMQTATGRAIAERRHAFMEQYVAQFLAEWQGTC